MTDKRASLSATTVRYQRTVLRIALKQAEEWGLVSSNAAAKVKPPQVTARKVEPIELKQANAVVACSSPSTLQSGAAILSLSKGNLNYYSTRGEAG